MISPAHATERPADLRTRIGTGDRSAFDALVDRFWGRIMAFFWRRVAPDDARDLTQNAFVAAYRALVNGKGPASDAAAEWERYLLACAKSQWIDHRRRLRARPPAAFLEDLWGEDASWQDRFEDRSPANADPLLSAERCRAIGECLQNLDPLRRSLCWMHFVDALAKREIARRTGKAEATIRVHLVEALRFLRGCLEGKGVSLEV